MEPFDPSPIMVKVAGLDNCFFTSYGFTRITPSEQVSINAPRRYTLL